MSSVHKLRTQFVKMAKGEQQQKNCENEEIIEHLEHHLQNDMIDMKENMMIWPALKLAVMFDTFQI